MTKNIFSSKTAILIAFMAPMASLADVASKPPINQPLNFNWSVVPKSTFDYSCSVSQAPVFNFGNVRADGSYKTLTADLEITCDRAGVDFVIEFPAGSEQLRVDGYFYAFDGVDNEYGVAAIIGKSALDALPWLTPHNGTPTDITPTNPETENWTVEGGALEGYSLAYDHWDQYSANYLKGRSPSTTFRIPITGTVHVYDNDSIPQSVKSVSLPVVVGTSFEYTP